MNKLLTNREKVIEQTRLMDGEGDGIIGIDREKVEKGEKLMEKGRGKGTDTLPGDNDYLRRGDVKCLLENVVCLHEELPAQIDLIPAADVVPVRHGRWKKVDDGIYYHMECSECGCRPLRNRWVDDNELSLFCPNCGALMDKDGDGDV